MQISFRNEARLHSHLKIDEEWGCGWGSEAIESTTILVFSERFADKQIVRLQETPDDIPEGGTPHTVSLLMHDKLVDAGKPGDRVESWANTELLKLLDIYETLTRSMALNIWELDDVKKGLLCQVLQ
ncbi:hypothetical protein Ddye_024532 [Dipteronia dyeriana]|uniref:MCM OB domain-containing protein n=1 Tax=Dipteronia dyeriana TaxID=168575 RepID=A0AAD9TVY0_9ROSI|nr:hypothetical protein Ddye_024532 [Dipteronia dyeriana]